ncbi:MAG: hypothetical protein RL721_1568 [Candidatus Eisenbacteria bacterium]
MSLLVFSTEPYAGMRDALCRTYGYEAGRIEWRRFPDGERHLRVLAPVRGRDVVLLGGTTQESQTTAMLDLACSLVDQGAGRLTIVLPFYGYGTMERATMEGEVVTARTRALLFSAVPRAPGGNRLVLLDPHDESLPFFFAASWRASVLPTDTLVEVVARRLGGTGLVLASPDAGRAARVQRVAERLGAATAFVHKRRLGPERTEVVGLVGEVRDRNVVLHDDLVRSGSTLLGAARALREAGAARVSAFVTHAVLPGETLGRIEDSRLLDALVVTDSHPRASDLAGAFLQVVPVAPVVGAWLLRTAGVEGVPDRVDVGVVP